MQGLPRKINSNRKLSEIRKSGISENKEEIGSEQKEVVKGLVSELVEKLNKESEQPSTFLKKKELKLGLDTIEQLTRDNSVQTDQVYRTKLSKLIESDSLKMDSQTKTFIENLGDKFKALVLSDNPTEAFKIISKDHTNTSWRVGYSSFLKIKIS